MILIVTKKYKINFGLKLLSENIFIASKSLTPEEIYKLMDSGEKGSRASKLSMWSSREVLEGR